MSSNKKTINLKKSKDKLIPTPEETIAETVAEISEAPAPEVKEVVEPKVETIEEKKEEQEYLEATRVEVKPSLWQRIKNSKVVRAISYVMKIKVTLVKPVALPEGRGE